MLVLVAIAGRSPGLCPPSSTVTFLLVDARDLLLVPYEIVVLASALLALVLVWNNRNSRSQLTSYLVDATV